MGRWGHEPDDTNDEPLLGASVNLPAERDLTLIFERDDIRTAVSAHCRASHDETTLERCPSCRLLIVQVGAAIDEWLALVDQDRAGRMTP